MTTMDKDFMSRWIESPLKSLYYSLQVLQDTQDKSDVYAAVDNADLDSYLSEILSNEKQPVTCDCAE